MSESLSELPHISEEAIIQLLNKHYQDGKFYSKIGQIFFKLSSGPDYSTEYRDSSLVAELNKWSRSSSDKSLNDQTHIFRFAEELRRYSCDGVTKSSQSLIVRGINGSGKSDSIKRVLQYLTFVDMSSHPEDKGVVRDYNKPFCTYVNPFYVASDSTSPVVGKRIAACLTLLEAFYTAPTDHNLSSSRVWNHFKLRYGSSGKITGFRVDPLFHEFSRYNPKDLYCGPLTIQTIFINGSSNSQLDHLLIPGSLREQYNPPIKPSSSSSSSMEYDYQAQLEHLKDLAINYGNISSDIWENVMKVVAAMINLQGITLLGTESAIISSSTKSFIGQAETLLGVESGSLGPAILKKNDERIGRPLGSIIDCKPSEAKYMIEYLCAELWFRTVSYLLNEMSFNYPYHPSHNSGSTSGNDSYSTLHLLDCIGWDRNGLNQHGHLQTLLNAYAEEKINEFFINKAFNEEIDRYLVEGITITSVPLPEWSLNLDIIERTQGGFIQILDETCLSQRPEDKVISDKIILNNNKSKLVKSGGPRAKQTVFIIKHSFCDISYDCEGFIMTNKTGTLPPTMNNCLKTSKISFISSESHQSHSHSHSPKDTAATGDKESGTISKIGKLAQRNDLKGQSPSSFTFHRNKVIIEDLIKELNGCDKTNYLLCVNLYPFSKSSEAFPADYVSSQVKACHLEGVIKLSQSGFSYSRPYHDIYRRFRILIPFSHYRLPLHITETVEKNYREYCKLLLEECVNVHNLSSSLLGNENENHHWESYITYGNTVIYMKEKFAIMLESYRFNYYEKSNLSCLLVQSVIRMRKFRKSFLILRHGIILLQSYIRCQQQQKLFLYQKKSALLIKSLIIVNYRRKYFLKISKAVNILKKNLLGKAIQRIRYKRLIRATHTLHNLAKGFIIRKYSQNVYESIRMIQKMAKLFILRKRLTRLRLFSAILIQYNYRGYKVRSKHYHYIQVLKVRKEQRIANYVIKKLQSHWRKKLVIERFHEIILSTIIIQRWIKTRMKQKWYQDLQSLVIKLQSYWRRLIASKQVNAMKVSLMVNQEKESLSELFYDEITSMKELNWENHCIMNEAIRYSKNAMNKSKSLLLFFDFCFDLSFAYSEGWLKTIFSFQQQLKKSIMIGNESSSSSSSSGRSIKSINIGNQHTIIVDDKSSVYTMGLGDLGQLGHGHRKSLAIPKKIEKLKSILSSSYAGINSLESKITILQVTCGKDHTLLLTHGGLLFSWGDNRRGQLGHSQFESCAIPKVVVGNDSKALKNITSISCGSFHSAAIAAESGILYTWGNGDCLGTTSNWRHKDETNVEHGKMNDSCIPNTLPMFHKKKILQVSCGENHIVVLCSGELYAWGSNQYGQLGKKHLGFSFDCVLGYFFLGLGNTKPHYIPTKITTIQFHEFDTIHAKLYSGGRHMLFHLKGKM
jgi:hypothetical protein